VGARTIRLSRDCAVTIAEVPEFRGLHCDTTCHCGIPKSVLTNVIVPSMVSEFNPLKSMFPPAANVTGPPIVKNVIISPGPRWLWIVAIGVIDVFRPTVWIPKVLIEVAGDI
jgi:hypothetical protein